MDYRNLKYFREPHKINEQQLRQYLKLQDYNFILQHILGKTNTREDQVGIKNNKKDIKMLKDELQTRRMNKENEYRS